MKIYTIKIAVGSAYELAADGDYVRVRSSAVDLIIENIASGEKIEVSQGDDFEFSPFKNLRISHASGSEQTVKLIISKGKKAGSAQVGGSINVANNPVPQCAFSQTQLSITNTNSVISYASTTRRYFFVQNNDPVAVFRLGLTGFANATNGIRLMPGDSFELDNMLPLGNISGCFETATSSAGNITYAEGNA